ncbi:hypothetical protein WMY93_032070 [Mugilogobius chulae]|uniref:Ig-like domain-containing protein n=1 Tax=Mugilogobius chulae TaxID=88201 RepID=A0AAW0MJG9_9GOBI
MRAGAILSFMNGTFLVVNDVTKSQSCVHVRQSPSSAAVVPGRSVSLQCSLQPKNNKSQIQCPQQDNVHWFRAGSEEPHTGLMSNSTNYSCVYRLSKTIGHSSDAGTYYCAVDTCGQILFGTGTKVDIEPPPDPVTVVLSVLLCGCVLVIIVLCVCVKRATDSPETVTDPHSEKTEQLASYTIFAALNQSGKHDSVYSTAQYKCLS